VAVFSVAFTVVCFLGCAFFVAVFSVVFTVVCFLGCAFFVAVFSVVFTVVCFLGCAFFVAVFSAAFTTVSFLGCTFFVFLEASLTADRVGLFAVEACEFADFLTVDAFLVVVFMEFRRWDAFFNFSLFETGFCVVARNVDVLAIALSFLNIFLIRACK